MIPFRRPRILLVGKKAFTPLSVNGCLFAYESVGAVQGVNNSYCDNAFDGARSQYTASTIYDLSGNGYHQLQATASKRPFLENDVNSQMSYKFGAQYYTIAASKPTGITAFKIYWVANNLDTHGGGLGPIMAGLNGSGRVSLIDANNYRARFDGVNWDSTGTHTTNALEIWSYEFSGSGGTQKFFRNNVLDRSGAIGTISSGADNLSVGTIASSLTSLLRGNIHAMFAYNNIPGSADDSNIWNYLSDTYGVPI